LALSVLALGSTSTIGTVFVYRRFFRRIRNGDWITPDVFAKKRWIKGVVTTVGDADNFRLYHTPGFGWRWPIKFRRIPSTTKDLKDETIHIRIGGVDAPEAAHFGRPAQPYAPEALAWLKNAIEGKTLYCQLMRRDQYSRIVAVVEQKPLFLPGFLASGKSLSLEMLKAGWVTTYEQAGAEYGEWGKDEFLRVEAEAKAARRGMWKLGTSGEKPSEYKRRHARAEAAGETSQSAKQEKAKPQTSSVGWFGKLWGHK